MTVNPPELPSVSGPMTGHDAVQSAPRENRLIADLMRGSVMTTVLAIVLSMVIGGILIAVTNEEVQRTAGYFFAQPMDMLAAVWNSVSGAYAALFRGGDPRPRAEPGARR